MCIYIHYTKFKYYINSNSIDFIIYYKILINIDVFKFSIMNIKKFYNNENKLI